MKSDPRMVAKRARQLRLHRMVQRITRSLPNEILELLENVAIVVQDEPAANHRRSIPRGHDILGLYQGVPRTNPGSANLLIPDKITIFTGPIVRHTRTNAQLEKQIRRTLLHEIGHHMGFDEAGVRRLGL